MTPAPPPALIFDWRHRPRTWLKLSFFLILALAGHLAGFLLFSVRTPPPARAMPVPASIALAPVPAADPAAAAGHAAMAGLASPAESADLDLPEQTPPEPHVPSYADHVMARQPWPGRPEPAAWPEISGVSQPALPPTAPPAARPPAPAGVPDAPPR